MYVQTVNTPRKKVNVEKTSEMPRRIDKQRAIWLYGNGLYFWYMERPNTVQDWSTNILAVTSKTV